MFYFFLIFGLLIRLLLIPVEGFKADVAFWKGWGLAVADKGIIWLVNNTNYNYPPGFAYVLWLINKVYALFKNPYEISSYWSDNNVLYLLLIKIITIIADLVVVWMIIKIGEIIIQNIRDSEVQKTRRSEKINKSGNPIFWYSESPIIWIVAILYFLNPAVIYDGVVWGQK